MFSRFTAALYNAVDALAPPLPLQEDFLWHWKSVTKFYTGRTASNKIPIEMTTIPGHLLEMLSILEQEEKELEHGSIGPCMEYIMQHKILETMCVLGTADAPPGMKRHMLIFVTRMLKNTQQSLIPHVSIYTPLKKFMQLCGEILAAPTEKEEIEFLEVICEKIKENPHLINCFTGRIDNGFQTLNNISKSNAICDEMEFLLVDSLLKLFQSPDNDISSRASGCLKTCCSLANDSVAITVVQSTQLSHVLCSSIVGLYNSLSKSMKLSDIEEGIINKTEDDGNGALISPEKRKFLCYMRHLDLLDSIILHAHPIISDYLSNSFRKDFLNVCVYPDLVDSDNVDDILFVTTLISSSVRYISSTALVNSFGVFLLGEASDFEIPGHSSHLVKDLLIKRCRESNGNLPLSMATLQLLEELLQNPTEEILHNLVINNLESRGYLDHTSADSWLNNSDNEDTCSRNPEDEEDISQEHSFASKTFAPPYIHKILDCFLTLIPDNLKSCETEEESGYDTYVKEAHSRFIKCLMSCENFDWPQDPVYKENYLGPDDDSSSDSQPEAESSRWVFFEGAFMNMLFEKLEQMLEQPHDINLQVTSLVSRIALFAHPNVHEYLLNPLIPYSSGTRSLFLVLLKVVENIQLSVQQISSFKKKLKLTRNVLLSDSNENTTFDNSNVLEALIVIEEFCKELAAIAFVKYHAAS